MRRFTSAQREAVAQAMGDLEQWRHDCHSASIHLVRARVFEDARVARGSTLGVPSQHSWVVLGDVYEPRAIIDPTHWSYVRPEIPSIQFVTGKGKTLYHPHGSGIIWQHGCPQSGGEEEITLNASLSLRARRFLEMCKEMNDGGPLDRRFWMGLANSPMGGWPSSEIIAAMDDTPELSALIPIDILGHVTDRNPDGLYLAPAEQGEIEE